MSDSWLFAFMLFICVVLAFCRCWFKCPFVVAVDFDRYFSTACSVNPGHDKKFPFIMAVIQVDLTGLKHAACS
jgi:hypothetical protein